MRLFRRLEIEVNGSDAFGLGPTNRTIIRRLEPDKYLAGEAGSSATTDVFNWLKDNYFGFTTLRKMMLNSYLDALKKTDSDLAELIRRATKDVD